MPTQSRSYPQLPFSDRHPEYPHFLKSFLRRKNIPVETIHFTAEAVSIEEANVIAHCFRVMVPQYRVRVIETRYLTDYRIEVYEVVTHG